MTLQRRKSAGPTTFAVPRPACGGHRRGPARILALVALLGCSEPAEPPGGDGPGGMHDHGAHHGGVVAMAGALHVEAIALPDGSIRVYPTDLRRKPIPATDVTGSVGLDLPEGPRTLPLVAAGPRLEAKGPPLTTDEVVLHLSLSHAARPSALHIRVPVGAPELAGLPRACQPVPDAGAERSPRCAVRFPRMVRIIGATPDARTALVAVFAHGVTAWRLPAGELALGLSPMPGADEHPDHDHPLDALAVRPDGVEVVVSAKGRILRYSLASGEQIADLPGSTYVVRALAWSADGQHIFASTFHDGVVRVLRPEDAGEVTRFAIDRHLVAFALSAAGDLVVLASEEGPLTVFEVASGQVRHRLDSLVAAPLLAFVGRYLVAGRQDGALEVWNVASGKRAGGVTGGPPPLALAVQPGGALLASAGDDGLIRLHALPGGESRGTLRWHDRPVQALAFSGPILLSGDSAGNLALWDAP